MKKAKVLGVVIVFILLFCGAAVEAQGAETKKIFSMEKPTWISNAGMSKGINHDRQDLGFVLKANAILKMRVPNGQKLTLRLLGNDAKKEKQVTVGADWVEISGEEDLVPFIDTPFDISETTIEYSVTGGQTTLPIYSAGSKEVEFFRTWDTANAEYALIKGQDFQLFVPKEDKEKIRKLQDFNSINDLLAHYAELFAMYNELTGFDNSSAVNKNGENRYFLKADRNGAGGAYYGGNWSANSTSSADMWLRKRSWGTLHEIAHGYQAGFDNQGMFTGEVSNNLFGVQHEYEKYGKSADQTSWLFDYGKKNEVEQNLYNKLVKGDETYASIDLREKLILMTMLKQKAGNEAFTKMYQGYRELANQPGFVKTNYPLPNLLNAYYSEHSKLDFAPVLIRWGLTLTDTQATLNRAKGYPAVASLADVVPEEKLAQARALIDPSLLINSNFEMVKNSEIASLGLKGELNIQLETKNISELIGAKIQIKDGHTIVQEKLITDTTTTFTNLPNGVYSVAFSGGKMVKYIPEIDYVYVKEAKNEVTVPVKELVISQVANQKIVFTGLGDVAFGEFTVDLNSETAVLSLTAKDPHSYFSGKTYASVKISDAAGNVRYDRKIEGANIQTGEDSIQLLIGDQVEIYHAETKNRLVSSDEIISSGQTTNKWTVTEWGLQNQQLGNSPEDVLIKKVDQLATALLQNDWLKDISMTQLNEKKQLYVAIQSLSEAKKNQLMEKYAALFTLPKVEDGSEFQYTFKGLGDWIFSTIDVSIQNKQATIMTKAGKPHVYFNEGYGIIHIQSNNGMTKYEKNYTGSQVYSNQTEQVALLIGDYITVTHKEYKDRLAIENKEQGTSLETAETITYQLTDEGLKRVATDSIPKSQLEEGSEFQFTFKGLGDKIFSVVTISIKGKYILIDTKAGKPHAYFNENYGTIQVKDRSGRTKCGNSYVGTQQYSEDIEGIDLLVGDSITITHKEYKDRLILENLDKGEQIVSAETVTYQVTADGLVQVSN